MKQIKNNTRPFDGMGKGVTLLSKAVGFVFITGFSLYYFGWKNHDLTMSAALAIVILAFAVEVIFLSVNLSIMINNIAKLKQAVLGKEEIKPDSKEGEIK